MSAKIIINREEKRVTLIHSTVGTPGPPGEPGEPGSGVTILGTETWTVIESQSSPVAGDMWLLSAPDVDAPLQPGGSPAEAGDGIVWDSPAWINAGPIRGPEGEQGPQGPQGEIGPEGPKGDKGDPGDQAIAAADITDATADGIALITSADANPFTDANASTLGSALQSGDVATVATTGAYGDLTGSPTIPSASDAPPANLGTASSGSSSDFSRADHVHNESGGASALPDLTDVDSTVASPSDGDILVYRDLGADFVLEAKPAAGSNPAAADITDATADGIALITSSDANPFTDADESKLDAISGTNTGDQTITLTGDVTGSGTGSIDATIPSGSLDVLQLDAGVQASLGSADTATQPGDLSTVATTGAYSDLTGSPTIPAASDATPANLGTAAAGSSSDFSRADHVHNESGGASALPDLTDVDSTVASPSDGDILVYRSAGSDFVLESKPAAGSNPAAADISDATADGIALITSSDANPFTDDDESKLDAIEPSADVTDSTNVGAAIAGVAGKTTPVDADTVPLIDSADSDALKQLTWANIKATIKSYYDSVTATFTNKSIDATANTIENIGYSEIDDDLSGQVGAFEGMAFDKPDNTVVDDSGLKFETERLGGGDIDFWLGGQRCTLDCTTSGKASVALTAGADANTPATNYLYVTASGSTATLQASTTLPTGAFAWVGKVVVPDATTWATTGAFASQRYTESMVNNSRGLFSHEREKLRAIGAVYISGVSRTLDITTNAGSADNVHFETGAGSVYQLHRQSFAAFTTGPYYLGNGDSNSYEAVTDLNAVLTESDGTSLAGKRFNLVIWGAVNCSSGLCKLFVNRPTGSYTNDAQTQSDRDNTADYTVPDDMRSVAFPIARIALRHRTIDNGTWTELGVYSLLGQLPGVRSGGAGAIASNEYADSQFAIYNTTDPTKELDFDVSGVAAGTTRTITAPDADIDLGDVILNTLADAKGDLLVASADDTVTRLAVGTNDHVLTADSTQGTGIKWAAVTSGSGDVTKVGAPANNELAVWTGDGTLEGESDITYDGTTLLMTDKVLQRPVIKDYGETYVTDTDSGATHSFDLSAGNVQHLQLTAACTISFTNPPATGTAGSLTVILEQDATGSRSVTWPASVDWADGTSPAISTDADAVDIFTFITVDAGTRWYGFTSGLDFS